jgi:hypothetical protein
MPVEIVDSKSETDPDWDCWLYIVSSSQEKANWTGVPMFRIIEEIPIANQSSPQLGGLSGQSNVMIVCNWSQVTVCWHGQKQSKDWTAPFLRNEYWRTNWTRRRRPLRIEMPPSRLITVRRTLKGDLKLGIHMLFLMLIAHKSIPSSRFRWIAKPNTNGQSLLPNIMETEMPVALTPW